MPANGQCDVIEEPATYSDAVASSSSDDEQVITTKMIIGKNTQSFDGTTHKKLATIESIASKKDHEDFFRSSLEILIKEAIFDGSNRDKPVLDFKPPEELLKLFDFELNKSPSTHEDLIKIIKDTIKYSVKIGHPYFVNQLFSSVDPYGMIGQFLTDALNPSVYTYEVSPVFTLMEEIVLKEMRIILGWQNGKGDGIFCPGGSMSNGYAINCARFKCMPDVKTKGLHSLPPMVLFTSEDAHYSIKKMSAFLGLGSDNVRLIKTDDRGRMDPKCLEEEILAAKAEHVRPFMVSATSGTTVLGAFDPLEEIADVCEKYGLWLHVDAAWGGGALVSRKHRKLLAGIERADSVTWNPHKLLTAPQQCSAFLVRHEGLLSEAHCANAAYLFQKDKFYDTKYDTGDKHVQCGRRADVFKFWFMWKAKGTNGLEQHIDKVFDNSKFFLETIRNREGFELVLQEPQCTNICFWYIPPSLRNSKFHPTYTEKLHRVAPKIKERMMKKGSMMVTYQRQKDLPNFFRIVFQNSGLERSDMLHLVEEFERLGHDL